MSVYPVSVSDRTEPLDEAEDILRCGDCAYYREVYQKRHANNITHCVGVCIIDIFKAKTLDELAVADVDAADPTDEPCEDFKEEM